MAAVITLTDLTIGFGEAPPLLSGFSMTLAAGSFTCLVGAAGVGKSSLLRTIAGLERPRTGTVTLSAAKEGAATRSCALVFREPRLLPWRPVIDNVMLGLEGLALAQDQRLLRAQAALAAVGLADHAGRWPDQLAPAEAQRVNLARALAVRPRLLLLDHPFSTLEIGQRQRLQGDLLRLVRESGLSALFATRDLDEAVVLADRVIVLSGRPSRVIRDFPVTLPHPRQLHDGGGADQAVRQLRDVLSDLVIDGEGI